MVEVITFEKAVEMAVVIDGETHVLLGNGFSRACKNDIFDYSKLRDNTDFKAVNGAVENLFDVLETADFERVMRNLQWAAYILGKYDPTNKKIANEMKRDAKELQKQLVSAIANTHPSLLDEITDDQYAACRLFLSHFSSIFTLNYDLLLYWALMHKGSDHVVNCDDGFRFPENGEQDWVTWYDDLPNQNIFYLHGALHIYQEGPRINKFTWRDKYYSLVEQIHQAMMNDKFPLFVAEGSSEGKLTKINSNPYLYKAFHHLEELEGTLFLHGMSLGSSDEHILKAIERSQVTHLFISLYGQPDSASNSAIQIRAAQLQADRKSLNKPLVVTYYDAASAKVWG